MTATTILLLLVPVAYVLGSIPFGLIVGRAKGIDPRKAGSGNIGATNVGRLLGGKFFALVFTLDLVKGLVPMLAAAIVLHNHAGSRLEYVMWLAVGMAAIFGHMFSVFIGFKGGKGVATATGVAVGLFPYYTLPAVVALAAFVLVFSITRIVSISSIAGAIVFPAAYVAIGLLRKWPVAGAQLPLLIFAVLLCGMIVYRHRTNISRLLKGTENRFAAHRPAAQSAEKN